MDPNIVTRLITVIMDIMSASMKFDQKLKNLEKLGCKDETLAAVKQMLSSNDGAQQVVALTILVPLLS
jgi:hypothetical protein